MRRVTRSLALLCLAAWAAACASSRQPALDAGRFNGNNYENQVLGFQVVLPSGWVFLKPEQLESAIRDVLAKKPAQDEVTKAALARTKTLFGLVDLANLRQAGGIPRSITATLESLDGVMVGMTSETYAAAMRTTIETNPAIVSKFGQWRHQTIAGQDFVALPTVVETEGKRAHQDYFVRVAGGQALGLVVIYPEDAEAPNQALDAFQPLPQAGRDKGVVP